MDPNKIELTTTQKIVPLLRAINEELPWQVVVVLTFALSAAFFGGAAMPVFWPDQPGTDFFVRRILLGFIMGFATFGVTAFTLYVIEDKILPFIKKVRGHYDGYALEAKKKVLEDVIEDEVLNK